MRFSTSLRDAAVVARFHLLRASRTRSAWVLTLVVSLVMAGGGWIFSRVLLELERNAARMLKVPETSRPGAMLDVLKERQELNEILRALVGDAELLEWALALPILTVEHFWLALGILPFLAAAAGAEVVAPDVADRSIRHELLRTGRLELVYGRLLGQSLLVGVAALVACVGTWAIAAFAMVQQPLLDQAISLLVLTPRLWAWSMPFLGLGVGMSVALRNVNVARGAALLLTLGTFIGYGLLRSPLGARVPYLADVLLPLLPQGWMKALWGPGSGWLASAGVLLVLAVAAPMLGWPVLRRRNL